MIVVSEFEGGFREADVGHLLVVACDFRIVDDVGCQAVPLEGAAVLVPTVASLAGLCLVNIQDLPVVGFDYTRNVRQATIADLQCVTVEDSVELRLFREMFVDQLQEGTTDVCCNIHTIWGIEPYNIALPVLAFLFWPVVCI